MKLKTETNNARIEKRILESAEVLLNGRRLCAEFEHGQWWVIDLDSGATWSVVDAEGGRAYDGFDFEQISYGEDE